MKCYSLENLVEIRAAGLSLPEVEQHVETCERCGRRWELAGHALRLVTDAGTESRVPDRLRGALLSIPARAPDGGVKEVIVDAKAQPGAGVFIRGAGLAMPFQRLYEAGEHDIDLSLGEGGRLQGQVLPLADEGVNFEGAYCLLYGGTEVRCGTLGAGGEFALDGVSSGPYDLVIESPKLRLVLRGLRFDDSNEDR